MKYILIFFVLDSTKKKYYEDKILSKVYIFLKLSIKREGEKGEKKQVVFIFLLSDMLRETLGFV